MTDPPLSPAPAVELHRVMEGAPRDALRSAIIGLARLSIRLRIEGTENIPAEGPILVAANHVHNLDPLLLAAASPRTLYFMAKRELFEIPLLGALISRLGGFPVDRGSADRSAIRYAEAVLAQGEALAMFPEGTRSPSGILQEGHAGAGLILQRSAAPLLPVGIIGTAGLPGNGSKKSQVAPEAGNMVIIRFGRPVRIEPEPGERLTSRQVTARIMDEIAALLPDSYRPPEDHSS